jgi:hypothetical protein
MNDAGAAPDSWARRGPSAAGNRDRPQGHRSVRVIKRRLPVGVALAWLSVILILPLAGAVLYLLFGEYRLGRGRRRRAAQLAVDCQKRFPHFYSTGAAGDRVSAAGGEAVARVAEALLGAPPLPGNRLELLPNAEVAFPALLADIDRAAKTCAVCACAILSMRCPSMPSCAPPPLHHVAANGKELSPDQVFKPNPPSPSLPRDRFTDSSIFSLTAHAAGG